MMIRKKSVVQIEMGRQHMDERLEKQKEKKEDEEKAQERKKEKAEQAEKLDGGTEKISVPEAPGQERNMWRRM